jgi:putative membrane protein
MDTDILIHSARGIDEFVIYLGASLALLALFISIYVWITPYREISLIREGNTAAAASLSGAVLGFAIPLAHAIAQSVTFLEMAMWGVIALAVQTLVFFVVRKLMPGIAKDIPAGKLAPGILLGSLSLATGLLNSACMTY